MAQGRRHPSPKPMMLIAYSPLFKKNRNSPSFVQFAFLLNLRFLLHLFWP